MEKPIAGAEDSKDDEPGMESIPKEKKTDSPPHKGHRKRQRKYLNAIREQMEFYFGDANLSKDRFLMQLISQDPFVPLEIFLTFNKLKKLTTCTADIAKSLSNSELLEIDSDRLKVRRKTALPTERNVEHKTLYVESLPPTADHDWVKTMFSRFGPVTYVSLPRYSKSKKIKEFGFIEFDMESSVEKAVKAFQEFNGVLCMENTDPAELTSVKSFIREKNNEKDSGEREEKINKKRRRASESGESQPDSKRSKQDPADEEGGPSSAAETDEQNETDTEGNSKRKRQRKKKKRKRNSEGGANSDADFIEIRILPKKDWKQLRNKYLNLQREKTAELKRLAWKNSHAHHTDSSEGQAKKAVEKPTKRLEKMNMNFYGAGNENDENQAAKFNDRSNDSPKLNPAEEKAPLFTFEPGLIVEVGFLEPCVTVKEFKADMRQYEMVKYVDIKEGAMQAFLRLDSPQSVADFVKQVSCAEYNCKVLAGDAESEYWERIKVDREAKLNKKVKIPKKRGREKMKKVISKHLRFGDDDAE